MITVTVCVGSSCHLKGARQVIASFDELLERHGLKDRVLLKGAFCMERCGEGINWQIDSRQLSSPTEQEAVRAFTKAVLGPLLGKRPRKGRGGSKGKG